MTDGTVGAAATTHEREITRAVELCTAEGALNRDAVGWTRSPLHACNLPATLARKKRWNYWCVTDESLLFSATVADIDFVALAFVYLYDRRTGRFAEKTAVAASGTVPLPAGVDGDIVFDSPILRVALTDEGAGTRIAVDCADFDGGALHADLVATRPEGHETLGVVIPWSDSQYQYTSKQNTLPASGAVTWGADTWELARPAFACLDYGRGVWPEHTVWNWGAASGVQSGRTVGLNLGGQWTDGTGMTENALCIDGRLTKIGDDLHFEYDTSDLMRPWRITSARSALIELRFDPEYERVAKADAGAYMSEVHQMFGVYSGTVVAEGGERIAIDRLFGWIESHEARW